jgi:Arc/MetJ-type ribon-helix-helix transcriptional regulator
MGRAALHSTRPEHESPLYETYTADMTSPVPTRFTDDELMLLDELVALGAGANRSDVIRRGVHHLADTVRRAQVGQAIARSYAEEPQDAADDALAMANAVAMTEAEPW